MTVSVENISEEKIHAHWLETKKAHALTFKKTLSLIWSDSRQKRAQMVRPLTPLSIFLGLFSINVVALIFWRLSMWLTQKQSYVCYLFSKFFYFLNIVLFSFDASPASTVGPGLVVAHLVGCTIHGKIGKNCLLYGRNALGGMGKRSVKGWLGGPVLEDGVVMGFGSAAMGPVTIGRGATIGAGAWCFEDVPETGIAVGIPAQTRRFKSLEEIEQEKTL